MATKQKAPTKNELQILGKDTARKFVDAAFTADTTQRSLLLSVAIAHCNDDQHIKVILEGFAEELKNEGMSDSIVRVRKSEFKAVFDAVSKTGVSEENQGKLSEFKGTYHAFIDLCRELRGKTERSTGTRTRTKAELTAKQLEKVEDQLGNANTKQLAELGDSLATKIQKVASPQLAGLTTLQVIQSAALSLMKNGQAEEFFKAVAQNVLDIVEPAIEQADKAMQESNAIHSQVASPAAVQTAIEGEAQTQ